MSQRQSPWLETVYGWAYGDNGWNAGMDSNLLKFSVMFDRNVDSIVASLPPAVNGQVHYNTTDNRLYFAVNTTYFSTPVPKWFSIVERTSGNTWQFNGTSLIDIEGIGSLNTRLEDVELTLSTLGSAAFEDISAFATQPGLDIVEAQAQGYTDFLRSDLANVIDPAKGAGLVGVTVGENQTTVAEFAQNRGTIIAKGLGVGVDSTAVLQAAVNYWDLNPNMSIRVVGHLETQGTVQIPNKETLNPARRLTITGGDLAKYNAGFMFTRPPGQSIPDGSGGTLQLQTGHVTFDDVRFLGSRTTAGTYIIDGDNMIRTKFVNCYGDGIQIAYAAQYLQSIYVDTASVFRNWKGWLFDCGYLYDVKFYGAAEAGDSFMRTRDVTADPAANSLVVRGVIEGLSGKVFELGVCFGVVIEGNYQEANAGGDYDFSVGNGFHKGLTLIGNGFQPNTTQLADPNYYPVKLGKGAANSITLIGNSSTGNLFDVHATNESTIIDVGNWCTTGKKLFSRVSREFSFSDGLEGLEGRFRLVDGLGVGLHSYYEKFGFESTRATVGGESVSAGLTMGTVNPQTTPDSYSQKNWTAGTFVFNKSPTIGSRQYGEGVSRDALILGWVCQTAGTPGVWREVPVMLPF